MLTFFALMIAFGIVITFIITSAQLAQAIVDNKRSSFYLMPFLILLTLICLIMPISAEMYKDEHKENAKTSLVETHNIDIIDIDKNNNISFLNENKEYCTSYWVHVNEEYFLVNEKTNCIKKD